MNKLGAVVRKMSAKISGKPPPPSLRKMNTCDSLASDDHKPRPILKKTNSCESLASIGSLEALRPASPRPILKKTNSRDSLGSIGSQRSQSLSPGLSPKPILKKTNSRESLGSEASLQRSLSPPQPIMRRTYSCDSLGSQTSQKSISFDPSVIATDKNSRRSKLKKTKSGESLGSSPQSPKVSKQSPQASLKMANPRLEIPSVTDGLKIPYAGDIPLPKFAEGGKTQFGIPKRSPPTNLSQDTSGSSIHRRRNQDNSPPKDHWQMQLPQYPIQVPTTHQAQMQTTPLLMQQYQMQMQQYHMQVALQQYQMMLGNWQGFGVMAQTDLKDMALKPGIKVSPGVAKAHIDAL